MRKVSTNLKIKAIMSIFWRIIIVLGIFAIPYFFNFKDPVINAKFWYLACIMNYIIVGDLLAEMINQENVFRFLGKFMEGLWVINIIITILLFLGFFLSYFTFFPLIVKNLLSNGIGFISFIIFLVITARGYEVISHAKEEFKL